jgi:ABC-type lipoprotein export system ATPase subunit
METALCPVQQQAFDTLMDSLPAGSVFAVWGDPGSGKSTVLREAHRALGGRLVTIAEWLDLVRGGHPLALEEAFERLLYGALSQSDVVLVDDLHLVTSVTLPCGYLSGYPRRELLKAPLSTLAAYAAETNKKLIFATEGSPPGAIGQACLSARHHRVHAGRLPVSASSLCR